MDCANNNIYSIEPLVSVIVPVYKVEKYLDCCLQSVINQSYKNLEIILVDDGSPDNCGIMCDAWSKKNHRIKVVHQKNGGLSVARNRGLKIAQGDYICYVDSDDWISNTMIEVLLKKAIDYDLDMVKCAACETSEKSDSKLLFSENFGGEVLIPINDVNLISRFYFSEFLWKIAWNGLYKKEIAKKVLFPQGLCFEDNYSAGMFLFYSKRVMAINDILYFYRINFDGISKGSIKRPLDKAYVTLSLIEKLKKEGHEDVIFMKKVAGQLATEIYHYIRDVEKLASCKIKIKGIENDMYIWCCENLDVRRRLIFKFLILNKKIQIIN